jgi:MFS family permease
LTIQPKNKTHPWLNRNVVGMGVTSFLSDACHEMATAVLPGFLSVIGAPPSALGLIEGSADAVSSFVKLWGGWVSDKLGRRKLLTTAGYFLTGISTSVFAFAVTWHPVLLGRVIGWLGRGFKGPIRDAMLSDSVEAGVRGKAFGFHRAADTLGAIAGPLVGVWLLSLWQGPSVTDPSQPFRPIFLLTLIPGVLSAAVFWVMVTEKRHSASPHLRFWSTINSLPKHFRQFLVGVGIFGLGDCAPTLLILAATTLLTPAYGLAHAVWVSGMLYALRNITYAAASFPIGALSDRFARQTLLALGYLAAVLTTAGFMLAFLLGWTSPAYLCALFVLAGVFIAAEDTLEGAITADHINTQTRGIGMGVLGTVNGIGDFGASVMVGLLWTLVSPAAGFGAAAALMLIGAIIMFLIPGTGDAPTEVA